MKIHLAESPHWEELGEGFRRGLKRAVQSSYNEAASLLPFGSDHMNIFLQPREDRLIDETHDAAQIHVPELIRFGFSPLHYGSYTAPEIRQRVRETIFHEMNHDARLRVNPMPEDFRGIAILEGLATVFERDYGGGEPLWSQYPPEVDDWMEEIGQLGEPVNYDEYMFNHPDGRKWIGYKVGTYIVDRAMKQSGESVIDLTRHVDYLDILNMAEA
ncbi:MAG TPA: DUF2268 domain-containing putative Zn-dependent protease [Candidatus Saccharimonadales bacterium]|nr:DUF2268 domain-containing putative Zn-dependent protease [Candidatus Saccharimonadales bacterium]